MTAAPPSELSQLGLDSDSFVKAGSKNWRGACPRCGGHRRFVLFTDHPFPKWNFFCEGCGIKGFADDLNASLRQPISEEKRREWAAQNAADKAEREKTRREKLAEFTTVELWEELAHRLNDTHRAQWRAWGIPDEWTEYLRIGFTPAKVYIGRDSEKHLSPAFTIPYFHTDFEFCTIQYRLFDPPTPTDRYRFEHGLGTTYYQAEPNVPIGERALIVEGAKKAIVTHVHAATGCAVLGVPSKGDFGGVVDAVKDCDQVFVLLDPDAEMPARKLAAAVGKRARIISLPVKVDDGITLHGMTPKHLADAMLYSRPA